MSPPASDDDPFHVLGLKRRFSIDESKLRAAHRHLLAAAHPDRAGLDSATSADAARRSSAINDAYRALAAPLPRAEAILRLEGAPVAKGDSLSPQFLAEMMDVRELLDDAIAARDLDRLAALCRDGEARRAELLDELASSLDRAVDANAADKPALLAAARTTLNHLRYFERLLERAAQATS